MSGRLVKREFTILDDHVYVLHTYSNGRKWVIVQYPESIIARRVRGHVSDHSHHFSRPFGSGRSLPKGAQTHPSDTDEDS